MYTIKDMSTMKDGNIRFTVAVAGVEIEGCRATPDHGNLILPSTFIVATRSYKSFIHATPEARKAILAALKLAATGDVPKAGVNLNALLAAGIMPCQRDGCTFVARDPYIFNVHMRDAHDHTQPVFCPCGRQEDDFDTPELARAHMLGGRHSKEV